MKFIQKLHCGQSVLVALAAGLLPTVIVPFQTYLGNQSLFNYSSWELMREAAPAAVLAVIGIFASLVVWEALCVLLSIKIGRGTGCWSGRLLHVGVLAWTVCEYLEVGLLSFGIPPLNGELMAIVGNPFRKIIDGTALVVCAIGFMAFARKMMPILHWIAIGVLIMLGASLADVHDAGKDFSGAEPLANGFCPRSDVVKSFRYSKSRNVLLFILDSTPASLSTSIMRQNPDLQRLFPGFTAYSNNLSMAEITIRGLPGLMTGRYLQKDDVGGEYTSSVYGTNSLLMSYVEAGCPVYFSPDLFTYGYTNRRLISSVKRDGNRKNDGPVFARNSVGIPYLSLRDIVRFRMTPYCKKYGVLYSAIKRANREATTERMSNESSLYPILAKADFSDDLATVLGVFHTKAVHPPVFVDAEGKRLPNPRSDREVLDGVCHWTLQQLGVFFAELRRRGIYDSCTIVVAADHGCILMKENEQMHGAESSILWVKPSGEKAPFRISKLSTSNCRVADLLRALVSRDIPIDEVEKILYAKTRRFIAKDGITWYSFGKRLFFYEWIYDEDGALLEHNKLGVFRAN